VPETAESRAEAALGTDFATGADPLSVAKADFDRDGDADAAFAALMRVRRGAGR
jgi:hypothetical protein